ncbi:MAG TPA: ankyrin repeat domain-containing protein [Chthonomonadaceae bacterium]|nr:ankyrin repeat domain-containing protein [Chthonomonadaceae bacterium]
MPLSLLTRRPQDSKQTRSDDRDLENAVKNNDIATFKMLLHRGVDPNARITRTTWEEQFKLLPPGMLAPIEEADRRPPTLLMEAAYNNDLEIVKLLLQKKADVNASGVEYNRALISNDEGAFVGKVTALDLAAWTGHLKVLNLLLQHGAKVDLSDSQGWTALMWAVAYHQVAAMRILLKHHANINIRNVDGRTVAELAAKEGYTEEVRLLLKAGSDPAAKDTEGKPLRN